MEEKIHRLTAELHFGIAEEMNKEYNQEKDYEKRTSLRVVAARIIFTL